MNINCIRFVGAYTLLHLHSPRSLMGDSLNSEHSGPGPRARELCSIEREALPASPG